MPTVHTVLTTGDNESADHPAVAPLLERSTPLLKLHDWLPWGRRGNVNHKTPDEYADEVRRYVLRGHAAFFAAELRGHADWCRDTIDQAVGAAAREWPERPTLVYDHDGWHRAGLWIEGDAQFNRQSRRMQLHFAELIYDAMHAVYGRRARVIRLGHVSLTDAEGDEARLREVGGVPIPEHAGLGFEVAAYAYVDVKRNPEHKTIEDVLFARLQQHERLFAPSDRQPWNIVVTPYDIDKSGAHVLADPGIRAGIIQGFEPDGVLVWHSFRKSLPFTLEEQAEAVHNLLEALAPAAGSAPGSTPTESPAEASPTPQVSPTRFADGAALERAKTQLKEIRHRVDDVARALGH